MTENGAQPASLRRCSRALRPQDLKKLTGGQPVDTVIHDGAPNIGSVWASEAYTQSALVLDALRFATETLAPGGTFVSKIFRWGAPTSQGPSQTAMLQACLIWKPLTHEAAWSS